MIRVFCLSDSLPGAAQREQAGAGLDSLTAAEMAAFTQLNDNYKAKFEFPFILAVKGIAGALLFLVAAVTLRLTCCRGGCFSALASTSRLCLHEPPRQTSWTRTPNGAQSAALPCSLRKPAP